MTGRLSFDMEPGSRPEAMADVPGVGEICLTKAVVQYRDHHEVELRGGRIEDIGLALVLDGRTASSAEAVDLGSGAVKLLDLSMELVVLDWVYQPTLDHVHRLLEERASVAGESSAARAPGVSRASGAEGPDRHGKGLDAYCFDVARQVLARVGFGPLTRSTLLRIGFRDVCRDLDLHEATSVRLSLDGGPVVRARLDYDSAALAFRTSSTSRSLELERALGDAFGARDVRRVERVRDSAPIAYQVRFPLPLSLEETRSVVAEMRAGLEEMLARFEPRRFRATHDVLHALGSRETLARLRLREPRARSVPLMEEPGGDPAPLPRTVH